MSCGFDARSGSCYNDKCFCMRSGKQGIDKQHKTLYTIKGGMTLDEWKDLLCRSHLCEGGSSEEFHKVLDKLQKV